MDEPSVFVEPKLPYPTRRVPAAWGSVEVYEIPEQEKAAVLESLYPFDPVPKLKETMLDIHEEKTFRVLEFLVVRDCGMNMLVSPYYPISGGSVIDWMPADTKPGDCLQRKIRGGDESILTHFFGFLKTSD